MGHALQLAVAQLQIVDQSARGLPFPISKDGADHSSLARSRVRLLSLRTNDALDAVHEPAAHVLTPDLHDDSRRHHRGENRPRSSALPTAAPEMVSRRKIPHPTSTSAFSASLRELNAERTRGAAARFDEHTDRRGHAGTLSNYYCLVCRSARQRRGVPSSPSSSPKRCAETASSAKIAGPPRSRGQLAR